MLRRPTSRMPNSRMMRRYPGFAPVLAGLLLLALAAPGWSQGAAPGARSGAVLRIGTGGQTGTYFPIGSLIARAISDMPVGASCAAADAVDARCGVPGIVAVAQISNGSVANVAALQNGEIEMALVQADVADWAYNAREIFTGRSPQTGLRFVAHLYSEAMHVVVRRGAKINSLADLRGRAVAMDEPGSGTLIHVRNLLQAYGLSEADVKPVYIKPDLALPRLQTGQLDLFFIVAGWPTRAVSDAIDSGQASLMAIDANGAGRLVRQNPFLSHGQIPAGAYGGQPAVPSLMVGAQLFARADLSDDQVQAMLDAIWSPRGMAILAAGHPRGADIRFEAALTGRSLPLHPGAERFYRARGLIAN